MRMKVRWQAAALERGEAVNNLADLDDAKLTEYETKTLADCRKALTVLDTAENYDESGDLRRDIIAGRLASVVGSFPTGAPGNPQAFVFMMLEHVVAIEGLNLLTLDSACRHITATKEALCPPSRWS